MAFSLSGTTITQSGTDTSYAGMSGLAGVSVDTVAGQDTYTLNELRLIIQGTLTINGLNEQIRFRNGFSSGDVVQINGGNWTITALSNGIFRDDILVADFGDAVPTNFGANVMRPLNGGEFNLQGGLIYFNATTNGRFMRMGGNGIFRISNAKIYNFPESAGSMQITGQSTNNQLFASNSTLKGVLVNAPDGTFIQQLEDMTFTDGNEALVANVGSVESVIDVPNLNTDRLVSQVARIRGRALLALVLTNPNTGAATVINKNHDGSTDIFAFIQNEVTFNIENETGAALTGAKIYAQDVDNGNRFAGVTISGVTLDYSTTQTYAATGATPNFTVLAQARKSTTSGPTGIVWEITDNRGVSDSTEFPFFFAEYTRDLFNTTPDLNGLNSKTVNILMLPDFNITEQNKATVDAYTTIETPAKFYDRAKADLVDNFLGETTTTVGITGSLIDAKALNVVLDPVASVPYDLTGSTVTVDAGGTFTGDITTTGDVTLAATMTSFVGDITATNINVADNIDVDNNTLTGIVNFTTAASLTGVTAPGTIVYNDNTDRTITYDGVTANVVRNDGTGNITINLVNGATVADSTDPQITTQAAPTPSSFALTATTADIWAIYDNTNTLVTTGSNSTVYNNADTDTGVWAIVLHRLGHVAQIATWQADDGSANTLTFGPSEILRPEGGSAYSGGSTTGLVALRNASDYLEIQVPNSLVTPQQVVDAQQDFLHTNVGLDLIFDTGVVSAPTWGNLNGVTFFLSITGYQYDSISGATPESAVGALLVSSATHTNVRTDNGGTVFAGVAEVDPASLAQAVWDYLVTNATTPGSTGAALTIINNGVKNASILVPHGQDLT